MADTAQPEVQTPAIETAPVVETQQAEPQTAAELHESLAAQLSDPNWTPEKSAPEVKTEEPAAEPVVEEPKAEEPEAAATEEPAAEPAKAGDELPAGIERPRLSDPNDQVIAALKKAQPSLSWAECEARVMGTQAKAEPVIETPAEADPLAAMQTELAEVDVKLKEWGDSEGLTSPEIVTLIQKRGDLAAEIRSETKFRERDQKDATQQKQTAAEAMNAKQQEQVTAAVQRFPELATEGGEVRAETDRLLSELKGSAFLNKVTAPVELAEIANRNVAQARSLKNGTTYEAELAKLDTAFKPKPTAVAAVTPVVTLPAKPAQPKITPAGGNRATQQPDQPATEKDELARINSISDPREQKEALDRYFSKAA